MTDYKYQHRITFWNVGKLKVVHTAWFENNDPKVDLSFEIDNDLDLEIWIEDNVGLTIDQILDNNLFQIETRVPRYDDIEEAAE